MDITVPEAAERTGLSAETIRRWIRAGKLPARKVGTQHQIDEADLVLLTAGRRPRVVTEEAPVYRDDVSAAERRLLDRIVVNPGVLMGKPVIRGTRISVEFVLECFSAGWTEADMVEQYPHITAADVRSCFAYAARRLHIEHRIDAIRRGEGIAR